MPTRLSSFAVVAVMLGGLSGIGLAGPSGAFYRAPDGCPRVDEFKNAVLARTSAEISFQGVTVRLEKHDGPLPADTTENVPMPSSKPPSESVWFSGILNLTLTDGTETTRLLNGKSCAEVVAALAFVTALAIDPRKDDSLPEGHVPQLAAESTPVKAAVAVEPNKAWKVNIGFGGSAQGGVTPEVLVGVPVFFEAYRPTGWQPNLRVAFIHANSSAKAGSQTADFSWTAARVESCWRPVLAMSALSIKPCALVEAAALTGTGVMVVNPHSERRLWLAPGASSRFSLTLAKGFFVEMVAAATFPLWRDRFYFEPDITVHRSSAVTGRVDFSLGLSIL